MESELFQAPQPRLIIYVHGMHWIEHMDAHAMSLRPFTTSSVKKLYGLQPESVYAEEENPNPSFHPLPTQGRVNEH